MTVRQILDVLLKEKQQHMAAIRRLDNAMKTLREASQVLINKEVKHAADKR